MQQMRKPGCFERLKDPDDEAIDCAFARPAEAQTGQCYAHLGYREQTLRIGQKVQCGPCATVSFVRQLAQAGPAHG